MATLSEIGARAKAAVMPGKSEGTAAPAKAAARIAAGEKQMKREEPRWRELWAHFDGEQFTEVSAVDGSLQRLETREGSPDKPRHRPRLVRNRMTRAIASEVSVLTSRFPTYEVTPLNGDPDKVNGARTAEKALTFLVEHLKLRRVTFNVGLNAGVTGDGFAWPYWNPNLGRVIGDTSELDGTGLSGAGAYDASAQGPDAAGGKAGPPGPTDTVAGATNAVDPLDPGEGRKPPPLEVLQEQLAAGQGPKMGAPIREGDISVAALRQDQVIWEPGVQFEESPWHGVRLVRPVSEVVSRPDYIGPADLQGDASADTMRRDKPADAKLVFVYHYLERPSVKNPKGSWLQLAGGKLIAPPDDYPCADDQLVVHRMPWIERGSRRERSLGLGEMVIDIQRSINRIVNQIIVWRNLVLNPQVFAPEGALQDPLTDEGGAVFEYRGPVSPTWRDVPPIPASLYEDLQRCYADMDYVIGGGSALPAGVESGSAIQGLNEREMSFRSMLISNLADFYSSLGRHLLYLVAENYTEERLIQIKGRFGVESIPDFLGVTLKGCYSSVRVSEGSITPRTRAAQEAKIANFADRGWITPQQAMAALNGGTAEAIIDSFELDVARVHRQIQQLVELDRAGSVPPGTDPNSILPQAQPYDNHEVFVEIITQWCKTVEFERLHPLIQEAALNWLGMHQMEIQMAQAQQAQQLMLQAGGQGAGNAGRPQGPPAPPSAPSIAANAQALAGQPS